jgi:hypothetical protein
MAYIESVIAVTVANAEEQQCSALAGVGVDLTLMRLGPDFHM